MAEKTTEIFSGPPERPWKTNNAEIAAQLRAADKAYDDSLNEAAIWNSRGELGFAAETRSRAAHALAMAYYRAAIS